MPPVANSQKARRLLLGLAFGSAVSLVNHGYGWNAEYFSKVLGNSWSWLTLGMLAGVASKYWRTATSLIAWFLVPAVWSYYVVDLSMGTYSMLGSKFDLLGLMVDVISYSLIGIGASMVLGFLASRAARGGWAGVLSVAMLAAYISYGALQVHRYQDHDPVKQSVSQWIALSAVLAFLVYALGVSRSRNLGTKNSIAERTGR